MTSKNSPNCILTLSFIFFCLYLSLASAKTSGDEIDSKSSPGKIIKQTQASDESELTQTTLSNSPLINVIEEDLEMKLYLDSDDERKKIIRFAQIKDSQPVNVLQSSVLIQTANNTKAKLSIELQLHYQPKASGKAPIDAKNLTIVSSRFVDQGAGLHWSGSILGCRNSDCSSFKASENPKIEEITEKHHVPVKTWQQFSVLWDEDTEEFVFTFNEMENRIDAKPFIDSTKFSPENFCYARLSASISDADEQGDMGNLIVRFGKVYVNGHLYDNFLSNELDTNKWITGAIQEQKKQ